MCSAVVDRCCHCMLLAGVRHASLAASTMHAAVYINDHVVVVRCVLFTSRESHFVRPRSSVVNTARCDIVYTSSSTVHLRKSFVLVLFAILNSVDI